MDSSDPSPVTRDLAGTPGGLSDSAPRRTWMAAERTYLAWLRTGLGALGLALAVGRLLPALISVSHLEFGLLGAGYGLLGVFVLVTGAFRALRTRDALEAGSPLPTDFWLVWVLTVISIVLAVGTIILVFAEV
jgi:inner membrane protein YidH